MHDQTFQLDRISLFAKTPNKIFLGHIGSSLVLIYLAWSVLPVGWIIAWGVLEVIVTPILLYYLGQRAVAVAQERKPMGALEHQLDALICFIGISWGIFLALSLNPDNPAHFGMQMAIAAGASAASVKSLGIFKRAFYLYEIPFMTLIAIKLFWIGGEHIWLGVLVLVFMVMLCGYAKDTYDGLTDYFNVKLENLDLALNYQKAALQAQKANQAKSMFLTQANHELRQPIHAIGLLTACLRDTETKPANIEIIANIENALSSLSNLFGSLLNITALDQGSIKPDIKQFPIADVLEQTVRQTQQQASQNDCHITLVHSSLWVETDPALLGSIVQNLMSNAIKYAAGKRILIGVRRKGETLTVQVLDCGPGIKSELQEDVFNEFVRISDPNNKHIEGMGLGLSIVLRTASLLNLGADLKSVPNHGTVLSISDIPIVPASKPTTISANNQKPNGSSLPRIGLLEDDEKVALSTTALLQRWGYGVERIFLDQSSQTHQSFDLLISDFNLSNTTNGIEFAVQLAKQRNAEIPTLVVSGTLDAKVQDAARQNGFWSLHKPVHPAELRSVLLTMGTSVQTAEPR